MTLRKLVNCLSEKLARLGNEVVRVPPWKGNGEEGNRWYLQGKVFVGSNLNVHTFPRKNN